MAFLQLSSRKVSAVSLKTIDISSGWNFLVSPLYLRTITSLSSGPLRP